MRRQSSPKRHSPEMTALISTSSLHEPFPDGYGHGFGAVGGAKFYKQVFDMLLRDCPADAELIGDFGVVETFDERGKHFLLPRRERRRGRIDCEKAFYLW